jgi:hypothetical protein
MGWGVKNWARDEGGHDPGDQDQDRTEGEVVDGQDWVGVHGRSEGPLCLVEGSGGDLLQGKARQGKIRQDKGAGAGVEVVVVVVVIVVVEQTGEQEARTTTLLQQLRSRVKRHIY